MVDYRKSLEDQGHELHFKLTDEGRICLMIDDSLTEYLGCSEDEVIELAARIHCR